MIILSHIEQSGADRCSHAERPCFFRLSAVYMSNSYQQETGLLALVDNVGVLLVPAALIVVAAVGLPIS